MFVVLLRFSANKHLAPEHMAAHREWISKGVDEDPFVAHGIVEAEIVDIDPNITSPELAFLAG